jgi:hypothetical protein
VETFRGIEISYDIGMEDIAKPVFLFYILGGLGIIIPLLWLDRRDALREQQAEERRAAKRKPKT